MKLPLLAATSIALSLAATGSANAQRVAPAAIAVVDTARIFRECAACRAAQPQVQAQVTTLQQRAQSLGQALQTDATPVETAVRALAGRAPDAALQTRITALRTRQDTINQELSRGEQNIRSIQANITRQINTRLDPIITQVMTSRGANLVVDKSATISSLPALDVTTEVLAQLNRQLPTVSVTPLPAQPQAARPQGR